MNKIQIAELLENYVNGNCTPDEIALIDDWYKQYENNPGHTDTLSLAKREALKHRMLLSIKQNAIIPNNVEVIETPIKPLLSRLWVKLSIAALVILVAKFCITGHIFSGVPQEQVVENQQLINNTQYIVKQTLPDGSTVWLSPNAHFTFPKHFKLKSRDVAMQGECFFEVTKNPKRPFIITSSHIVTKVWGTSFRVTDNVNATVAKVIVLTGKVSVSKKDNPGATELKISSGEVILHPSQSVSYNAGKGLLIAEKQTDMAPLGVWKRVNLTFSQTKLSELVKVLNQTFDANIQIVDDRLNNKVMTADLNDLNLAEVLEVLKTSLKLNYEVNDDHIILKRTN